MGRALAVAILGLALAGCRSEPEPRPSVPASARNFVLITIDTLRADRVGAYGDRSARTPAIDGLAARGARFTQAFAVTPITLPSHASIMTGRYPAGHGARHNGMRTDLTVPTIADVLSQSGFATAAFVGAFPLDRRFGLIKGFQQYGDRMPRGAEGRTANERPGEAVMDEAIAWLDAHRADRFFLWVHLFEPHAPYGDPRSGRPAAVRYGEEIAEADRQIARLVASLQPRIDETLIALVADHGEAFGEHGEIAHSIFVYDTTLRIPMVLAGPGVPRATVEAPVSQIDIAPTVMRLLGAPTFDVDGIDLGPVMAGAAAPERTLYAESFAPLLDFGWSPLRSVRAQGWKYISAPTPELYHTQADPAESRNAIGEDKGRATSMQAQADKFSSDHLSADRDTDREAVARLQALGYVSGGRQALDRPDPKDRREVAARIARVTSGELHGASLEQTLRQILADDPANPLANLRLGYVLFESNRCPEAVGRFRAAIGAKYPSADAHLGLAGCQALQKDFASAARTLREADAVEPGNPVVLANLGLMLSDGGDAAGAINPLQRALALDAGMHQARFGLAIAFARAGRREEASTEARELLRRLPPEAPQRSEVERLIDALK